MCSRWIPGGVPVAGLAPPGIQAQMDPAQAAVSAALVEGPVRQPVVTTRWSLRALPRSTLGAVRQANIKVSPCGAGWHPYIIQPCMPGAGAQELLLLSTNTPSPAT